MTALLALTCCAAVAQNDQNRGQSNKTYRQFNEKQRQYARTYYDKNRTKKSLDRKTGTTTTRIGFSRAMCSILICGE